MCFLFCWALPRSLLLRCLDLRRNANLAGGFAGRFWLWWFCCCFVCLWFRDDLPKFLDHTCPCTFLLFTAYAIVRTEPSANRPNRRKKKWNETWSDWNEGWTADWTDGQWTEDWTWTGQESQQEYASSSQRPENSEIQSLVLSPLIGRIFGEISTGLVLQEAMDELGSSNSHSSWGDSVCVVSASGLSCPFNVGPPMCQCDNCEFQDWQLGRAMDRHQQMLQKMTHVASFS